jgi:hypothetical protein
MFGPIGQTYSAFICSYIKKLNHPVEVFTDMVGETKGWVGRCVRNLFFFLPEKPYNVSCGNTYNDPCRDADILRI